YILIEVSDTGTGIAPDIVGRIFEPFFSTKEEGKGTGLGLSMLFGFVKQSRGHVSVYSELGVGTTFRLYLPAAPGTVVEAKPAAAPARAAEGETVLVVEDNAAMRRIALRQIAALGYRALEAASAAQALEILAREPVDLLFTDVVMAGGSGIDL